MNETVVGRVLFPLHERLKGKPTFRWLAELERTQWLAPEQLAAYQFARLQALLTWAHERAPYYRELLEAAGLPEGKLSSPDDLRRVPFLTRDLLRARFDDLRARADLRGVQLRSSGGSTGQPVTVLVDMTRMGVEEAARLRAHRWFGLAPGAREVVLWGSPIELGRQDRIRQLRDQLLNSRLLSAFDLGDAQLAR